MKKDASISGHGIMNGSASRLQLLCGGGIYSCRKDLSNPARQA